MDDKSQEEEEETKMKVAEETINNSANHRQQGTY